MNNRSNKAILIGLSRAILPTVATMVVIMMLLKSLEAMGIVPAPSVSAFPDLTVLAHQSVASRSRDSASVLLVGDSTCLLGVDASSLSQILPERPRVLSLALVIWLDLGVYGEAVLDFTGANPAQVKTVILLVSPNKLNNPETSGTNSALNVWRQLHDQAPSKIFVSSGAPVDWLGIRLMRDNFFSHAIDTPTQNRGIARFGFASEVDAYMTKHQGSPVEFGTSMIPRRRQTNAWILAPEFEAETRLFRSRIPAGTKLLIGLTPLPKISSNPSDQQKRDDLLRQWNKAMNADGILTNLPAILPDVYFSETGHLNELGQKKYTALLAQVLAGIIKPGRVPVKDE